MIRKYCAHVPFASEREWFYNQLDLADGEISVGLTIRVERDDEYEIPFKPMTLQVVALHGEHVWIRGNGALFARTRGQFMYEYEAARRFWWYDIALTEAETRKIEQGNATLDSGRSLFAARLDAMLDDVIVVILDDERAG